MKKNQPIDHIVWAVPDLDKAITDFEEQSGVRPVIGGKHESLGTYNALVGLGDGMYLELIAVDPSTEVEAPRWMGVDKITESRVTRWAIKSDQLEKDAEVLKAYHPFHGEINQGQRTLEDGSILSWALTMPQPTPMVEVVPFLLDWSGSSHHPSERLSAECKLVSLRLSHPDPYGISNVISSFGYGTESLLKGDPAIIVTLSTPKGKVTLR